MLQYDRNDCRPDAPAAKIAFIKSLGGNIVSYNRQNEDRETVAATLQAQRNAP